MIARRSVLVATVGAALVFALPVAFAGSTADPGVTATTIVLGALASRDWRPMHHDHGFAVERNGTRDIFMNTPTQAAWFERYLTDWTGPKGRLGRMTFRMKGSVFPGDTMQLDGVVRSFDVEWLNWNVGLTDLSV